MTSPSLGQLWMDLRIPSVNLVLLLLWSREIQILFFILNNAMVGQWSYFKWLKKQVPPTLPSPEKASLRKHSKMHTSDNKEPNFLVATSNTNMCSHPHTVCTESVGQGYGSFTAQLDRQDTQRVKDSQRLCAVAALRLRRGGGKVTFPTCSKEQSLF